MSSIFLMPTVLACPPGTYEGMGMYFLWFVGFLVTCVCIPVSVRGRGQPVVRYEACGAAILVALLIHLVAAPWSIDLAFRLDDLFGVEWKVLRPWLVPVFGCTLIGWVACRVARRMIPDDAIPTVPAYRVCLDSGDGPDGRPFDIERRAYRSRQPLVDTHPTAANTAPQEE